MLVLSRKQGEAIYVNDDIRISVAGIRGRRVQLAIEAPRFVKVIRAEVLGGPRDLATGNVNRERAVSGSTDGQPVAAPEVEISATR